MARVNVDILGISKLKWTGMNEFNSDDHYIYYCGSPVVVLEVLIAVASLAVVHRLYGAQASVVMIPGL